MARLRRLLGIPTTVVITYKSGNQIRVRADSFSVTHNGHQEVTGLNYTGADMHPIYVGFTEIESIWEDIRS